MKKRFAPLLLFCLLLSGCSGLPIAREMGDMALLRALGVDVSPLGVALTGSTGPRARGLQAEGEAALTLSAEERSLSGACLAMQSQSDSYVFFGYVDQLLLGEELAREGLRPVLDYFARDAELGLGAQLWLVRGSTAREAVSSGGEKGIDRRLETLQTDSKMGIAAVTRTAGEIYTDLLELGSAYAPVLELAGDEGGALTENGYGIIKDGALAFFLEGREARGLELLAGGPVGHILEMETSGGPAAVRVTSACTHSELAFQGESPSALKLTCKIEARLSEYCRRPDSQELELLESGLEGRERDCLEAAVARLQAMGTDCAGLGAKAAIACPAKWQGIQADWPSWFSRVPVELQVEVKIL